MKSLSLKRTPIQSGAGISSPAPACANKKLPRLLALVLPLVFAALGAKGQITVVNGDFETASSSYNTGASGWTDYSGIPANCTGGAARNTSDPYAGAADLTLAYNVNTSGGGPAVIAQSDMFSGLSAGSTTLSFYAKRVVAGNENNQVDIVWFDASGNFLADSGFTSFNATLTSSYSLQTVTLTAPANTAKAIIKFLQAGSAAVGDAATLRIDNITMSQGASAPPAVVLNEISNGGFETGGANSTGAAGWDNAGDAAGSGSANASALQDSSSPYAGTYDLQLVGQGDGSRGYAAIALQNGIPIPNSGPVTLQFYAKGALISGGASPQYQVTWFNSSGSVLSSSSGSFPAGLTSSYQLENINLTAPANVDHAQLQFLLAVGSGTGDHWVVDLDNVALGYTNNPGAVVTVDPSKAWQGYMNVFELPQYGGGYDWGSPWAPADLDATFSGPVLTFTPNTSIDRDNHNDTYWWQDASGTSDGNKTMDASMYVQNDGLAGQNVTFSGYCWANTLVTQYKTNTTVFIKDLNSSYALVASAVANLTNGQPFSLSLATAPGDHIQYGFEMVGPPARLATVASLGSIIVASNAPPAGPAISTAPANATVLVGSNVTMTVAASGTSLAYQWQKNGVNLSDGGNISGSASASLTLSNCQLSDESAYSVRISNISGSVAATNYLQVMNPSGLTVDPSGTWVGYMNVFNLPADGGAYRFGQPWGTANLDATFSGAALTFTPNTSIDHDVPNDPFWWTAGGAPNKTMDASMYQQNDNLAGQTVTFSGYCLQNTLVAPYSSGTTVFVKDLAPDYSSSTVASATLAAGAPFSVTLATTAGDHIQFGFEMIGPDARQTNVASLGKIVVSVTPPAMSVAVSGASGTLSFPTSVGVNYTLQYTTNLASSAWQAYTNFMGSGSTKTITVPNNHKNAFFRLAF
jgi:Immunoglobulin I-set domain